MELLDDNILRTYGNSVVSELVQQLRRAGKENSGRLINSISYELKTTAENISIIINSEAYLKYVDEGRRPGSWPPISSIEQWVRSKGIPQSAAFPIARKIFRFGIEPTNVIQNTITNVTRQVDIKPLEEAVAQSLELNIKNNIEKIK